MASKSKHLKITAVGDGYVGKTCMIVYYATKEFPQDYVPTVLEHYAANIVVDGEEFNTTLCITAGQEDYEKLRPLSYPNTACFLLCFSVASRSSYGNVRTKWWPEIRRHCPNIPIVLVGTKIDLRDDPTQDTISTSKGKKLRDEIKAAKYVECSAKTGQGLDEIFIEGVRCTLKKNTAKQNKCQLL